MKYLFSLLLLTLSLFFVSNTYAQDLPPNDPSTLSEVERVVDKYSNKAVSAFEQAVSTITPVAESAFKTVVRLQIAKGVSLLLVTLLCLSPWYFLKSRHRIYLEEREYNIKSKYSEKESGEILFIINVITLIVGTITSTVLLYNAILYLLAPEWFAIKDILQLF